MNIVSQTYRCCFLFLFFPPCVDFGWTPPTTPILKKKLFRSTISICNLSWVCILVVVHLCDTDSSNHERAISWDGLKEICDVYNGEKTWTFDGEMCVWLCAGCDDTKLLSPLHIAGNRGLSITAALTVVNVALWGCDHYFRIMAVFWTDNDARENGQVHSAA